MESKITRTYDFFEHVHNIDFDNLLVNGSNLADMPLTHKLEWHKAEKILETGEIKVEKCDVFRDEKLAYFFYGRPAYAIANGKGVRHDNYYFPVCFILKADSVNINKVFPFDSGAYALGMYDGFIHHEMDINDFSINPTIASIKTFIEYFYGENDRYYKNIIRQIDQTDELKNETNAYINLVSNRGEEKFDERCSTVEIISKCDVQISNSLLALILPNDIARKNEHVKSLHSRGIDILTYDTFGGAPSSYNGVIRQIMYDYLCKKRIILCDK